MPPDLALLSTLTGSNYPCLELIFMVPKVFEPLKVDCILFTLCFVCVCVCVCVLPESFPVYNFVLHGHFYSDALNIGLLSKFLLLGDSYLRVDPIDQKGDKKKTWQVCFP